MAGDSVRIKGLTSVGKVESIEGKQATVIFGGMRTKMAVSRLEHVDAATIQSEQQQFQAYNYSREHVRRLTSIVTSSVKSWMYVV